MNYKHIIFAYCVACCASFLLLVHAQLAVSNFSIPLRPVISRFTSEANLACQGSSGDSNTYFGPSIVTSGETWFGPCSNKLTDLVVFNSADGSFSILNSSSLYGQHFQFANSSSNANPTIVPIDGNQVGKLQTNPVVWQSYGNNSGCSSTDTSKLLAYSAASDTFYSADCATSGIRMRHVSSTVDQFLDTTRQCLPDSSYMCSTPTVWNDGVTDHLFWIALAAGTSKPTKIVRQSVLRGGPTTNISIVGTDAPSETFPLCLNSAGNVLLQVHSNGKMLFGACPDGGLFYVDISDPSTTQTIHRVSTCTVASSDRSKPLVVTAGRAYVACKLGQQYNYFFYPLSVGSSGNISLSDNNYINLTPTGCSSVTSATAAASGVPGRPDAIWINCQSAGLFTNICGAGNALYVADAGDTYACIPCPSGSYQNSYSFTADVTCTPCSMGTYLASPSNRSCTFCPPGTSQNTAGQTSCTSCSAGTFQPSYGAFFCSPCETGGGTAVSCPSPFSLGSAAQLIPSVTLLIMLFVISIKIVAIA